MLLGFVVFKVYLRRSLRSESGQYLCKIVYESHPRNSLRRWHFPLKVPLVEGWRILQVLLGGDLFACNRYGSCFLLLLKYIFLIKDVHVFVILFRFICHYKMNWHVIENQNIRYVNKKPHHDKVSSRSCHRHRRSWWRHQMETFSALLAICAGNSPVHGEFPAQRPVTRNFDVYFDMHPNNRLSKQSWGWWFETQSRPSWRHRNDYYRFFIFWLSY